MNIKIYPSKASGEVIAPPSKSMAHRALICGALSSGSTIQNIAFSEDILATLSCLESMGAKIEKEGNTIKIGGLNPRNISENAELYCNESGSTLRFLIPLCLLANKNINFKGAQRLFQRPIGIYEDICNANGILFEKTDNSLKLCGQLNCGNYAIPGDISSQFITGLLFALPLLDSFSIIEIVGKLESASYVDLTLHMLSTFSIKITQMGNRFIIPGKQTYKPCNYTVEGDCSNAAFLEAFNHIDGNVKVAGILPNTIQGDRVYKEIFNGLESGRKYFDLSDCPDLAPIAFTMAAVKGGARFIGTSRLKLKESDRAQAMAQELSKFGVNVQIEENQVIIPESYLKAPTETLFGHNDHRIVMSLAVLSSVYGGEICGAEAVSKSYPDFFETLQKLNIGIENNET